MDVIDRRSSLLLDKSSTIITGIFQPRASGLQPLKKASPISSRTPAPPRVSALLQPCRKKRNRDRLQPLRVFLFSLGGRTFKSDIRVRSLPGLQPLKRVSSFHRESRVRPPQCAREACSFVFFFSCLSSRTRVSCERYEGSAFLFLAYVTSPRRDKYSRRCFSCQCRCGLQPPSTSLVSNRLSLGGIGSWNAR
jgi:hypothetical protein